MIKIKSFILDETKWLEVTWVDEISTQVEVEKEVDGETVVETETKVEETIVWCESFSGHPEHIAMLRAKAIEYETELGEYEELIAECEKNFIAPTDEEIQAEIIKNQLAESYKYLQDTDWYYTRKAETGEEVPADVVEQRIQCRKFIQENK